MKKILLLTFILSFLAPMTLRAGYQGVWTDASGTNHYSEPSSSSGSSGGGGGSWGGGEAVETKVDPKAEARKLRKKAKSYFKNGDFENAQTAAYQFLTKSSFGDADVFFIWARAMQLQHEAWDRQGIDYNTILWKRQVLERYQDLLNQFPKHKDARKYMELLQAEVDESRRAYEASDPIFQRNQAYNKGNAHYDAEEWEEAAAAYREAVSWDYSDHEAHRWLGWSLKMAGRDDEAAEAFKVAIQQGSRNTHLAVGLTDLLRHDDAKMDDALYYANKAVEFDPSYIRAYQVKARVLGSMDDRQAEEDEAYDQALAIDPTDISVLEGAMLSSNADNNFERMERLIETTLAAHPENEWAVYLKRELPNRKAEVEEERRAQEESDRLAAAWVAEAQQAELEAAQAEADIAAQTALASLDELTRVAEQSKQAANAVTIEQAKADSSIGFDTPMPTEVIPVFDVEPGDWSPERAALEIKLQTLKEQPEIDTVAIANVKQEISILTNQENFEMFQANEAFRDAVENALHEAPKGTEAPKIHVSEMSVGGEALSEEDKTESEKTMDQIRQLAVNQFGQDVVDQYDKNIDEAKTREDINEWVESDPRIKKAALRTDALMKEAEEKYERRQAKAKDEPAEESALIQAVGAPGAYQWPGEANPNAPLENPIALEEERELEILKIYQELKQGEEMMESYDAEDAPSE